jgi:NAD+--asparagine ADP-ribosyltransferase
MKEVGYPLYSVAVKAAVAAVVAEVNPRLRARAGLQILMMTIHW